MPENEEKKDREPFFDNNFDFLNRLVEPVSRDIWTKKKNWDFQNQNKDLVLGNYRETEIEMLQITDKIAGFCDKTEELDNYKTFLFREMMTTANVSKGRSMAFLKELNSRTINRREDTNDKKKENKQGE